MRTYCVYYKLFESLSMNFKMCLIIFMRFGIQEFLWICTCWSWNISSATLKKLRVIVIYIFICIQVAVQYIKTVPVEEMEAVFGGS
jgi:hypothetical protein